MTIAQKMEGMVRANKSKLAIYFVNFKYHFSSEILPYIISLNIKQHITETVVIIHIV